MDAQRGEESLGAIAERARLSRHQVARFFSTHERLHQFFALVHACSGRLSDFVAACVDLLGFQPTGRFRQWRNGGESTNLNADVRVVTCDTTKVHQKWVYTR